MYRLPNFNMLFQLVLLKLFKSELFSCLQKVDHVINSSKGPITACLHGGEGPQVGEVTRLDGVTRLFI